MARRRGRYRTTPARRAALRKAQLASARKRRRRRAVATGAGVIAVTTGAGVYRHKKSGSHLAFQTHKTSDFFVRPSQNKPKRSDYGVRFRKSKMPSLRSKGWEHVRGAGPDPIPAWDERRGRRTLISAVTGKKIGNRFYGVSYEHRPLKRRPRKK